MIHQSSVSMYCLYTFHWSNLLTRRAHLCFPSFSYFQQHYRRPYHSLFYEPYTGNLAQHQSYEEMTYSQKPNGRDAEAVRLPWGMDRFSYTNQNTALSKIHSHIGIRTHTKTNRNMAILGPLRWTILPHCLAHRCISSRTGSNSSTQA